MNLRPYTLRTIEVKQKGAEETKAFHDLMEQAPKTEIPLRSQRSSAAIFSVSNPLSARNHNYDDVFCGLARRLFTAFKVTNAVILVVPKKLL